VALLEVDLVTTDRRIWSGEATYVSAPAADGDIGILADHQPVMSVLRPGTVRIHGADDSFTEAHVDAGFLSVDANQVTVVVDNAQVVEG
jgi:F-type H+-transporting ATPase subunit epsilon